MSETARPHDALEGCDAVLFDIDGTLIDDSRSYREAIRMTAERTLGRPVTPEEIETVKAIPGFNNDWDTTWALVRWARGETVRVPTDEERASPDYRTLQAVFQTFYLGDVGWQQQSGGNAPFTWRQPLIERETLLISPDLLPALAHLALGIATSRPKHEAMTAIRRHDLGRWFDERNVVGLEDAEAEKPDPAPLIELVRRVHARRAVYVGDTVNDALAAGAAGMGFVHVGTKPFPDPAAERAVVLRVPHANDLLPEPTSVERTA